MASDGGLQFSRLRAFFAHLQMMEVEVVAVVVVKALLAHRRVLSLLLSLE